eukprot:3641415-Pyramimonas_sp.AAC.1
MRQYVEHKRGGIHGPPPPGVGPPEAGACDRPPQPVVARKPASVAMSICDLAHAVHTWRHQMHLWHGYFVHCDAVWPLDQP